MSAAGAMVDIMRAQHSRTGRHNNLVLFYQRPAQVRNSTVDELISLHEIVGVFLRAFTVARPPSRKEVVGSAEIV